MPEGTKPVKTAEKLIPRVIEDEMKQAYLDYSMSVIVGRALPDVRDGLKPVQRRVLYTMHELGTLHNKPFKKSARIVGEVMGKYHPHGNDPVYEALARMAQDFSLRYTLVEGQGNFGSVDGDRPAQMRYTEARLRKLAEEMLADIDKKTVKFVPNFDGSLEEPTVLPAKVPNLLINGSSGIAVGMATNIPPHNLKEVCKALIHKIDHPAASAEDLMRFIPAPDFPTGGIICGVQGIKDAYRTGRGRIIVRAKHTLEEVKNKPRIVITELPYQVNKAQLIEDIADLVRHKKVQGISDIRDESDKEGMRVVLELRAGANSDVILNQLYQHTRLQTTFGTIMLALDDGQPKIMNLPELLSAFIQHRKSVVTNRTKFELDEAEQKAHVLEGLIVALDNIDPIVAFLKKSKSVQEAKKGLVEDYKLTEVQSQAILEMRLQKLTSLEQDKIRKDHAELLEQIKELKAILADPKRILGIIKDELQALSEEHGDERKTVVLPEEAEELTEEELISPEKVVVTITKAGYVKRLPIEAYRAQRRGGRGITTAGIREEDIVTSLFTASTHDYLLCFTSHGKVHWLKVYQIPEASRYAKGTAIVNLLQLAQDERVATCIPVSKFNPDQYLFMTTKKGVVKKTSLEEFSHPRKGGIIAVSLSENDELISVEFTDGKQDVIIATANGLAIRFGEEDVRPMGRTAQGVIGIRLKPDDKVVGALVVDPKKTLLTVTEKGFGKRTSFEEYSRIKRGGVGVINIKITEKNGKAVTIKSVADTDEIIMITAAGIAIRVPAKQISVIGRATQGVRVIKLEQGDKVTSVAVVAEQEV